jgi:Pyruvate/2-oxoacid:ferredoxin oxidoreductase delta subunit
MFIDDDGFAGINRLLCTGCGVCTEICNHDAIVEVKR